MARDSFEEDESTEDEKEEGELSSVSSKIAS